MPEGRGTLLAIGEQADFDTVQTTYTQVFRIISETLGGQVVRWRGRDALAQGSAGLRHMMYEEGIDVAFDVELEVTLEGMGMLWKHTLWDAAITTGSGPYTHTREITGTRPSVPLTMEIVRGNSGKSDVVIGARITAAEWSVAVGELVKVKISVIGKSAARQNTGTIPGTISGGRLVVKHHKMTSAVVTWNSGSYAIRSFSLKLDRKLARNDKLGSLYTGEPPTSDFTDVTCEITRVQADEVWRTAHEAGTQSDLVIGFTDGTRSITWTVQSAMITACSDPISAVGEIMQSATFMALDDDTDPGLKQAEINGQNTGEAA
jgi:hypothetical protein